jgi:glycosyltransferase involved in cell wall biosynthesis
MFSNLFYPVASGSSTQSRALARELAKRGHEVTIVTARLRPEDPDFEVVDGANVYRVPSVILPEMPIAFNCPWITYTFFPGALRRIEEILRKHNPDVLHLHNHMFDLSLSAVRMSRKFAKPLVLTFHTVVKHANPFYNALLYPGDRFFLRWVVVRNAHMLICPDTNMQNYVLRAHRVAPTKVVPYGIDVFPEPDPAQVENLRRRHGLDGKRVILSLGHVHEVRHRRDEIRALPIIRRAVPNAVLLIVGTEMTDTPRRLARQLGLEDAVIFAGPAPHEEVAAYLSLADVEGHLFYQDAQEQTSLGISTLEAMGAGKAIFVAANKDSYGRNWLRDGENLAIVESGRPDHLAETVIRLLRDDGKRQSIGRAARELVQKHFSWESVCRQTLRVYRKAQDRLAGKR